MGSLERKADGNPYHDAEGHFTGPGGTGHAAHAGKKPRKKKSGGKPRKRVSRKPAGGGGGSGGKKSPAKVAAKPLSVKAARAKAAYSKTNKQEQDYAKTSEQAAAKKMGGKWMEDNEPTDVEIAHGKGVHGVEVKTMIANTNDKITMKKDAVARKKAWEAAGAGNVFHTVVYDHRDKFDGGRNAANYSGHEIYYRRGYGAFRVGTMERVKDHAELRKLMDAKEDDLPAAARRPSRGKA